MNNKKTLIQIYGPGRSGTTVLDLMISNDQDSFSLGEVHAWFRPFKKHHFKIESDLYSWEIIKNFKENEFHVKAFKILQVSFLIDSSKNLVWMIDSKKWAKKSNINVIGILIYKPIINYIHSIWKRGESIDSAINRYKLYYSRFFQSKLSAYVLNHDRLIKNPTKVLDKITHFTLQRYNPRRHMFWEKNHQNLFGSHGVRVQGNLKKGKNVKDNFGKEFESLLPSIHTKIDNDKKLKLIIEKLNKLDNSTIEGEDLGIFKPFWYYYLHYKQVFFKYFPKSKNTKL